MNIFVAPFVNALFGFYYLVGNLGWAVIIVTVLIRILLFPLLWPSLKSAKKTRELQPKLKKLQEKYKGDKQQLAKAQMELYKQEGVNPLSGCLPQLLQIAVLMLFFWAFNMVSGYSAGNGSTTEINKLLISSYRISEGFAFEPNFLGNNLAMSPAKEFKAGMGSNMILPIVLLLGSAILQFLSSKLMMPSVKVDKSVVKKTKDKEDDMMSVMRTQSTYMMPAMTLFIGWNFSLGILLYWFVNTLVMLGQQLIAEKVQK
jgi:YidC/Oxa1 family membrane protein insertase